MTSIKKHIVEAYSFRDSDYIEVAEISCNDESLGTLSPIKVEYSLDAVSRIEAGDRELELSSRVPASWDILKFSHWPGFLCDLLPQGQARTYWTAKLGIPPGPSSDWTLLAYSGRNPVGKLRIQNKARSYQKKTKGRPFRLSDIEKRSQDLLEYLEELGEPVSSFTGAGGASPKFFLVENDEGTLFAQTDIDERLIRRQYLIKFPASRSGNDKSILRAEAAYLTFAAKILGHGKVSKAHRVGDALVSERFDRIKDKEKYRRIGVESLYQRLSIPGHGRFVSLLDAAATIAEGSAHIEDDIIEFLKRDVLNILLSNTDLHGRNYSFLNDATAKLRLSPIYDLAPMAFSEELITRYARAGWRNDQLSFEASATIIDWKALCMHLEKTFKISAAQALAELEKTRAKIASEESSLKKLLGEEGVDKEMVQRIMEAFHEYMPRLRFHP